MVAQPAGGSREVTDAIARTIAHLAEANFDDDASGHDGLDGEVHHALQLVSESVCSVLGYGASAISLLRANGEFQFVAVAGPDSAREALLWEHWPASSVEQELAASDVHGAVRYLPHGRVRLPGVMWTPDVAPSDDPGAWHPEDQLLVLIEDDEGRLRGTLAVDQPLDGRVPDADQMRQLEAFVVQVGRIIMGADRRRRLSEQVRIASRARDAVRSATAHHDADAAFQDCAPLLLTCFGADLVVLHSHDDNAIRLEPAPEDAFEVPTELQRRLDDVACDCWRAGEVMVLAPHRALPAGPITEGWVDIADYVGSFGMDRMVLAPVGVGGECLGALALLRRIGSPDWTEIEIDAAREIGRDLGVWLLNNRLFARERQLAEYKQQLIATMAHELKNPLTAVRGHVEMLSEVVEPGTLAERSVGSIDRAAARLDVLVGTLLDLSRVQDAGAPREDVETGLLDLVTGILDMVSMQAKRRGVGIEVADDDPGLVLGDPGELELVVTNLVSNAVKYSDEGSTVRVGVRDLEDEVVLSVEDEGIGIAPADLDQLFVEFFRSADPRAVERPGTGLGLSIVQRVVQRHGGRVEVSSEVGRGTRFEVHLPRAASGA